MIQGEPVDTIEATRLAYGLRSFPFSVKELDPLNHDEHLDLVCPVDGWGEAAKLGSFLEARAAAMQPAIVVIAGGSGTGRTSLANFLIRKWADGRKAAADVNFDPEKLVVTSGEMRDWSDQEQLWEWVLNLWPQTLTTGYSPGTPVESAFAEIRESKPAALAPALQNVLIKLTVDLRAKGYALAGVLENVKKLEIVNLARQAFNFVDAILVVTVENTAGNFDAVLTNVRTALDSQAGRLVTLSNLAPPEARDVVKDRWSKCSDDEPPFDVDGLVDAFAGRQLPLARVFALMQTLLVLKRLDFGGQETWPAARQLAFSCEELQQKISYYDSHLLTRK